jgi:hypothetical protein
MMKHAKIRIKSKVIHTMLRIIAKFRSTSRFPNLPNLQVGVYAAPPFPNERRPEDHKRQERQCISPMPSLPKANVSSFPSVVVETASAFAEFYSSFPQVFFALLFFRLFERITENGSSLLKRIHN